AARPSARGDQNDKRSWALQAQRSATGSEPPRGGSALGRAGVTRMISEAGPFRPSGAQPHSEPPRGGSAPKRAGVTRVISEAGPFRPSGAQPDSEPLEGAARPSARG